MIQGSCLCGGVRYEYDGEIEEISMCHCSQCRKVTGSAFLPVSRIDAAKFRITAGAELLKEYRSIPTKVRAFCGNCGSPIYSALDNQPEFKRLRVGTVETPFACANAYHIFADSKASWYDITDTHPQYPQFKV